MRYTFLMSKRQRADSPSRQELSNESVIDYLAVVTAKRAEAQLALNEIETEQHKTVILLFQRGVTVRHIMAATGWSKSRCYQVRDGRR